MDTLPNAIPWRTVAIAPNRAEVESALLEQGYRLVHNPFGSMYVTKENRNHPDYKLSEAYQKDLERERLEKEKTAALVSNIESFIKAGKLDKSNGTRIAKDILDLSGGSLSQTQGLLQQFFFDYIRPVDTYNCYTQFRAFCSLADIPVNNNALTVEFVAVHDEWNETQSRARKARALITNVNEAIASGDMELARSILMRTHNVDWKRANEMLESMLKLAELQKRVSK